jgi:hypothetical protein
VCGTSCIPNANCCTASDCPNTTNVNSTACGPPTGSCRITGCTPGFVNVDGTYSNGCECTDSPYGTSCLSATGIGTIAVGGSTSRSAPLPNLNQENWFSVTFQYTSAPSYHPHIILTVPAGNTMVMDVTTDCSTTFNCVAEGGGVSTARTEWEVTGGGDSSGTGYSPTGSVGGTTYIRVRRTSGSPTCGSYTLSISN